jgi:hypothetical protein
MTRGKSTIWIIANGSRDCAQNPWPRDSEACSADYVSEMAGRFLYSFRGHSGEYYGGEGFPFCLVRSPELARIVFYRVTKPEINKMAISSLLHGVVLVGRRLTDLGYCNCPCSRVGIQQCNLLEARMIVTTYNQHVRLSLSSEPFGWFAPPRSTRAWEPTLFMESLRSKSP